MADLKPIQVTIEAVLQSAKAQQQGQMLANRLFDSFNKTFNTASMTNSKINKAYGAGSSVLIDQLLGNPAQFKKIASSVLRENTRVQNTLARQQQQQANQQANAMRRYQNMVSSGNISGAQSYVKGLPANLGGFVMSNAAPITFGQRWKGASQAVSSHYGKYIIAQGLAGNTGMTGMAIADMWKQARLGAGLNVGMMPGLIGGGAFALGMGINAVGGAYRLGKAGLGATSNVLGLNQGGIESYIEFDKALRLATNNLMAGVAGTNFGDTMKQFKSAALNFATSFGLGGNASDYANLMRRMSGLGSFKSAGDVILASRSAAQLSAVSEDTSPEESGRALSSIFMALQGSGAIKKKLSPEEMSKQLTGISALMWKAGAMSPIDISDLQKNAGNISSMVAGGASLSEALMSYVFMTGLGFSPAKAGTQMSSIRLRMPTILSKKGYDKILGVSKGELTNMSPFEFIQKLMDKKGGIKTATGIVNTDNPFTYRSELKNVGLILEEIFGLRGGMFMTLFNKTMEQEGGVDKIKELMIAMGDAKSATKEFATALENMNNSPAARVANAQGALDAFQKSVQGIATQYIGWLAGRATNTAEINRLGAIQSPTQMDKEMLRARKLAEDLYRGNRKSSMLTDEERLLLQTNNVSGLSESLSTVRNLVNAEYAGGPLQPINDLIYQFTTIVSPMVDSADGMKKTIDSIIAIFTTLGGVVVGLADVISNVIAFLGTTGDKNRNTIKNALISSGSMTRVEALTKSMGMSDKIAGKYSNALISAESYAKDTGDTRSIAQWAYSVKTGVIEGNEKLQKSNEGLMKAVVGLDITIQQGRTFVGMMQSMDTRSSVDPKTPTMSMGDIKIIKKQ